MFAVLVLTLTLECSVLISGRYVDIYSPQQRNTAATGRDLDVSSRSRSPWAAAEMMRLEQMKQKFQARDKQNRIGSMDEGTDQGSVGRLFQTTAWQLLNDAEQSRLNDVVTEMLLNKYFGQLRSQSVGIQPWSDLVRGASHASDVQQQLAAAADRSTGHTSDDQQQQAEDEEGEIEKDSRDTLFPASKRTFGQLRTPRELHPVYLGLGQSAASAALNTYASLLADDKRRENLEHQQQTSSGNPVRFIGRR
jgi:hypothetical protein